MAFAPSEHYEEPSHTLGNALSLLSYTTTNRFTCTADGYIRITSGTALNSYVTVTVDDRLYITAKTQQANYTENNSVYVRKGMTVYVLSSSGNDIKAYYYPFI